MNAIFQKQKLASLVLVLGLSPAAIAQGNEIGNILTATKKAICSATRAIDKDNFPRLKSVKLSLEIESQREANGTLKIFVVTGKGSLARKNTQQVSIDLKPDLTGNTTEMSTEKEIGKELKDLIIMTSKGITKTSEGKIPMTVDRIEITVGLALEKNAELDGGFDICLAKVGINGKTSSSASNSIQLIFEK